MGVEKAKYVRSMSYVNIHNACELNDEVSNKRKPLRRRADKNASRVMRNRQPSSQSTVLPSRQAVWQRPGWVGTGAARRVWDGLAEADRPRARCTESVPWLTRLLFIRSRPGKAVSRNSSCRLRNCGAANALWNAVALGKDAGGSDAHDVRLARYPLRS